MDIDWSVQRYRSRAGLPRRGHVPRRPLTEIVSGWSRGKEEQPSHTGALRLQARDQRRYYGLGCKTSPTPPHGACFFDDKSSITPFLANLIGYPNPRTGAPHDSADSECRGCSPLLQLNTQSIRLPQFPNSI